MLRPSPEETSGRKRSKTTSRGLCSLFSPAAVASRFGRHYSHPSPPTPPTLPRHQALPFAVDSLFADVPAGSTIRRNLTDLRQSHRRITLAAFPLFRHCSLLSRSPCSGAPLLPRLCRRHRNRRRNCHCRHLPRCPAPRLSSKGKMGRKKKTTPRPVVFIMVQATVAIAIHKSVHRPRGLQTSP